MVCHFISMISICRKKTVRFWLRKHGKPCCVSFSESRVELVPTSHVIGTVSLEVLLPTNIIVVSGPSVCVCSVLGA